MSDLADLAATELLARYKDRSLSPVEVTEAVIARIEAREPTLCALWAYDPEAARAAARDSEARWLKGEARALEGVPVTIKENIATKGTAVPLGTAARPLDPAPEDAPSAARLREAGTVLLAKTTMPDYGMLSSGLSSFHKLARNPWDTRLNPGGSSAGAGAAAAAGYGPLHVGTDIGGSIRLPAGWCGIVGLKPSFGRVPIAPPFYGRVAGPMTRSAADSALMMAELSRPDWRDGTSLPAETIDWMAGPAPLKGLRIGYLPVAGIGLPVDPEVRDCVAAAARLFEAEGAIVEEIGPFVTRTMLDGLDVFWRQRSWADIGPLAKDAQESILPYIFQWAERGRNLSGHEVYSGMMQMHAMRDATIAATQAYDYVISPVAPVVAYPAELASPNHNPEKPFEHICFTVPYNFSEQPAASVNAGFTKAGLPIGLQIAGRRFDDAGVLAVTQAFEALRGPQRAWP